MNTCKGCGAEITWIVTAAGKKLALDTAVKRIFVFDHKTKKHVMMSGYEAHWATCPMADNFRKKEKSHVPGKIISKF